MLDLVINNGFVVDGTGLPGRYTDIGIANGRIASVGNLANASAERTIDADGLVVAPGIVDVHTHYDPQVTWDPLCDTSSLHGVTSVLAGNCGFSVAPCKPEDRDYIAQVFARVEGMDQRALEHVDWSFDTFESFQRFLTGRVALNFGTYVGHSAVRRWVMGEAAYERTATPAERDEMGRMVAAAMEAGAMGFSSSHAPTHLDLADRPVPSRLADLEELRALADAVGISGRGSIAYAPESAVEGINEADRDLLIELGRRAGVPTITQGLGGRSKVDAPTQAWEESRAFLDRSAAQGAPVYSLLMARAMNGTFSLTTGTTRYEGVPLWHELMQTPLDERRPWLADPARRDQLRDAIDHPNTDPSVGSTLPPPHFGGLRVEEHPGQGAEAVVGRTVEEIATAQGRHPADVLFDLSVDGDLQTVFRWTNETPAWRQLLREVQQHPQMIMGVSDGGAHLDRDDGAEWSTHFLQTWWQHEKVWRLEEAIRLITSVPAAICGIPDRGVLKAGWQADVMLFDPQRLHVGRRFTDTDATTGVERVRSVPEGIVATIVNGVPVVEHGRPTGHTPGHVIAPA